MADMVVDSSVWIAAFLTEDPNHPRAARFMDEFRAGQHHCHLPYLVLVETFAAIARRVATDRIALTLQVRDFFQMWTQQDLVSWYDLDQQRAENVITFNLSFPDPLTGGDSVVASLSDEFGHTLKTFDNEILNRYFRATL